MPDKTLAAARFIDVGSVDELPEKGFIIREAGGVSVVLCKIRDETYAVENRCSHAYETFDDGRLRGARLMCPRHGACFDVRDGKVLGLPATLPIRSFVLRIVGDRIHIDVGDSDD